MGERFQRASAAAMAKREVLRVKRIHVEGLFGLYNHDIPLNADDRVTIIHGPNGVGKTVLLKMIAAVFGGHFEELTPIPFQKLTLELSNGDNLTIEIGEETRGRFSTIHTLLDIQMGSNRAVGYEITSTDVASDGTEFESTHIRWDGERGKETVNPPRWLQELLHQFEIHLIETQRLLRPATDEPGGGQVPTVRAYARSLHFNITEALASYATESQTIDQSFPQRLLRIKSSARIEPVELQQRLTTLNNKRAQLEKIGLLESTAASPVEVESMDASDPVQRNVISLYIDDTQQKLAVLDDIARRITLFLEYVNGKFRNKSIQISRENGFVVLGHNGVPIEPTSLSSGEQHELVQIYDLLFRVKPGTLVLIDEPELSLHLLWQKRYLSELIQIAKTAEFDAIVATHSPFIVGDRSDLAVALDADIDT